jgi:two-component system LytT family response regulator
MNPNISVDVKLLEVKSIIGTKIININNILYIKASNKNSVIYFDNQKTIKTIHLIKWYEKRLPKPEFYRCHNSYVVNCLQIDYFCTGSLILIGNCRIPMSRSRKQNLISIIESLERKYA